MIYSKPTPVSVQFEPWLEPWLTMVNHGCMTMVDHGLTKLLIGRPWLTMVLMTMVDHC